MVFRARLGLALDNESVYKPRLRMQDLGNQRQRAPTQYYIKVVELSHVDKASVVYTEKYESDPDDDSDSGGVASRVRFQEKLAKSGCVLWHR